MSIGPVHRDDLIRCPCRRCKDQRAAAARTRKATAERNLKAALRDEPVPADAHGTNAGYYRHSCRCEKCRAIVRQGDQRRRAARLAAPVPQSKHGTVTGYGAYGCRCDNCRAAAVAAKQSLRERVRGQVPDGKHGTVTGYSYYGCRCAPCTEAIRVANAVNRQRRREAGAR